MKITRSQLHSYNDGFEPTVRQLRTSYNTGSLVSSVGGLDLFNPSYNIPVNIPFTTPIADTPTLGTIEGTSDTHPAGYHKMRHYNGATYEPFNL